MFMLFSLVFVNGKTNNSVHFVTNNEPFINLSKQSFCDVLYVKLINLKSVLDKTLLSQRQITSCQLLQITQDRKTIKMYQRIIQ